YLASGLQPGNCYWFYVRAICSDVEQSTWAGPFNFCTLPLNDECSSATVVPVNNNLTCAQTVNGTLGGATASAQPTSCGVADDDVWFTFTAGASTHTISLSDFSPANLNVNFVVYEGTECGNLNEVLCVPEDDGAVVNGLLPGSTYYIRVFSTGNVPVSNTFNLCVGTVPCVEAQPFCSDQPVTYPNATNVPSLGTIGCLNTTPNPAFFFLQVKESGPLNYLITQSTTSGGVANLDVDYVVWGPYPDNATACAAVPNNPLPEGECPALHACSYLPAFTETLCLPDALVCEVYVVMITNFSNQNGFVTFTQINTADPEAGLTECYEDNTFDYDQLAYCKNDTDPTPILQDGAVPGVYTSTAGLVIDPATGTIDLSESAPGTYIVTSTLSITGEVTCENFSTIVRTRTVIISEPANATVSYSAATYCNSADQQVVTIAGTPGGLFTASPAGLLIDMFSGTIVPVASSPGLYTITYTIPESVGCPAFVVTTQVEILDAPVVTPKADVAACGNYVLPAVVVGDYFTGPNGTGTPIGDGTSITEDTLIYVFATNGTCSSEQSFNVVISPQTELVDPSDDIVQCEPYTLPVPTVGHYYAGPGGTGTILDGETFTTGTTQVYLYAAVPTCDPVEEPFTITIQNGVSLPPIPDVFANCTYTLPALTVGSYYSSPGGVGLLDPAVALTQTQDIYVYAAPVGCPAVEVTFTVNITPAPVLAAVSDLSDCESVTLPALTVGAYYSDAAFTTPLVNTTFTEPGVYQVYVYAQTNGDAACASSADFTVTIGAPPVVPELEDVTACGSYDLDLTALDGFPGAGYYSAQGGVGLITGAITQSQTVWIYAGDPGNADCFSESSFQVTIQPVPVVNVVGECQGAAFVLSAFDGNNASFPTGTEYSWVDGDGNSVDNTASITVTEMGTYTVTVSIPAGAGVQCSADGAPYVVTSTSCTIQKGISANADGVNDYFDLVGQNVAKLEIYNRYGMKVYEMNDYSNQWYGQSDKGEELPDGTYYYVIMFKDAKSTKTGWIYINRKN
ncbi:MAG: gliding motility-associated C-terminal domain-containing protein, partial [Sphingobacteriales bacterium]